MSAALQLETLPRFFAFELLDGRLGILCAESQRQCVHGHSLKSNTVITTEGVVRCTWKERPELRCCDADLFVALLHAGAQPVVKRRGERFFIVIEITAAQREHIINHPMTVMEKLAFLGAVR